MKNGYEKMKEKNMENKYDPTTKLHDLPDNEFITGGLIGEATEAAGYLDGGRSVINTLNWWNRPLREVLSAFSAMTEKAALLDRLHDAAVACHGKGAGAERQLFERLQGEYEDLTGDSVTEDEARNG